MNQKTVYQYDRSGRYVGEALADESPLETGVWHLPARTTEVAPPSEWPADTWPRWNGVAWEFTGALKPQVGPDPLEKLAQFLQANPDVLAAMEQQASS